MARMLADVIAAAYRAGTGFNLELERGVARQTATMIRLTLRQRPNNLFESFVAGSP